MVWHCLWRASWRPWGCWRWCELRCADRGYLLGLECFFTPTLGPGHTDPVSERISIFCFPIRNRYHHKYCYYYDGIALGSINFWTCYNAPDLKENYCLNIISRQSKNQDKLARNKLYCNSFKYKCTSLRPPSYLIQIIVPSVQVRPDWRMSSLVRLLWSRQPLNPSHTVTNIFTFKLHLLQGNNIAKSTLSNKIVFFLRRSLDPSSHSRIIYLCDKGWQWITRIPTQIKLVLGLE